MRPDETLQFGNLSLVFTAPAGPSHPAASSHPSPSSHPTTVITSAAAQPAAAPAGHTPPPRVTAAAAIPDTGGRLGGKHGADTGGGAGLPARASAQNPKQRRPGARRAAAAPPAGIGGIPAPIGTGGNARAPSSTSGTPAPPSSTGAASPPSGILGKFEVPLRPSQYLYEDRPGIWCLGVFDNMKKGVVIGAGAMRGNEVIFDLDRRRLAFLPHDCESMHSGRIPSHLSGGYGLSACAPPLPPAAPPLVIL
mmetsp:Transcript_31097/g.99408  ORF Transcript_31097/g.99408 Transcript_31097/m.99408 type:complete len:251 (+) Transcript_31097:317-1069(+)